MKEKLMPNSSSQDKSLIPPGGGTDQSPTNTSGRITMLTDPIPQAPRGQNFLPDQITLYGVKLNAGDLQSASLPFNTNFLHMAIVKDRNDVRPLAPEDEAVIAVIYGYAFDGRCYRNDKPTLLIFHPTVKEEPAVGCGFDGLGYAMWGITKKSPIMEVTINTNLAEEIVLGPTLPGNRNPNTYGNSAMLAHRGGMISRGGGNQI
jgi:hypothetical protein